MRRVAISFSGRLIFSTGALLMLSLKIRPHKDTKTMKLAVNNSPGITPAMKQCPIDTPARFP